MRRLIAYFWALPVTCVGLFLALCGRATGGSIKVHDGVVESQGGVLCTLLRRGAAMTLGHVILARNEQCLTKSRRHERVHVRQFEVWGPLLIPVAWCIGAWLRYCGLDPYLDHPFELAANADQSPEIDS